MRVDPRDCGSTHGGAGYAPGTHVNAEGHAICGICGWDCGPANYWCLPREMRPGYRDEMMARKERRRAGIVAGMWLAAGAAILGMLSIVAGWPWILIIAMPACTLGIMMVRSWSREYW